MRRKLCTSLCFSVQTGTVLILTMQHREDHHTEANSNADLAEVAKKTINIVCVWVCVLGDGGTGLPQRMAPVLYTT